MADGITADGAFDLLTGQRQQLALVTNEDGRLVGVVTRKGALRSTIYRPAARPHGRLMVAVAVGINGDVEAKAKALDEMGADVLVIDTAHGHQERTLQAVERVRAVAPDAPDRRRQRRHRRGHPAAHRRRRRHRQGRRRPGRDVHHPDDDRRRPPAVLRRARVRRGAAAAGGPRVGRRRHPLPPRRRPGPGGRRGQRDVRVVAGRHVRVGRRHAARPRRPALQGELRDGVAPGGAEPQPGRVGARPGPQGAVPGGHQHVADVPRSRAAGRRGHHRPDRRRGALVVHVRRARRPRRVRRASRRRRAEHGRLRRRRSPTGRAGRRRPCG